MSMMKYNFTLPKVSRFAQFFADSRSHPAPPKLTGPSIPPSNNSCPLLQVPTEIRLLIYDFVLERDPDKTPVRPVRPRVYYGLYRSCPAIHDEIRPALKKEFEDWGELQLSDDIYLRGLAQMYISFLRTELKW